MKDFPLKKFLRDYTQTTKKIDAFSHSEKNLIELFNIIASIIVETEMIILLLDEGFHIRSIFSNSKKEYSRYINKFLALNNCSIEECVFMKTYDHTSVYSFVSNLYQDNYNNLNYRLAILAYKPDVERYKILIEKFNKTITKLIENESSVYSSYNNLLRYLDNIDDGISACDCNGILRYINKSACDIIGAKREWLINKKLDSFSSNAILSQVIQNEKTYMDFEYFLDYNNKTYHLMNSAYPVYDEKKNLVGAVDTFRRITRSMKVANNLAGYEAVYQFVNFIGNSKVINDCIDLAKKFAQSDKNILIVGESGTGKELFAQSIHNHSNRKNGPFVAINCASFPRDLFDSELFGYDEGAFTGARKGGKAGKFEFANGGTLFLDEIGEMPMHLQAKLLRVLETRSISRLGSNKKIDIDIRIIAATNRNLENMVKTNNFRGDLFYRLKVLYLVLPSLIDRSNDIIELANYFIEKLSKDMDDKIKGVNEEAKVLLLSYHWPGNIRELENIIALSLFICDEDYITKEHLLKAGLKNKDINALEGIHPSIKLSDTNKDLILKTLEKTNGNKKKAAEILGISRNTIYRTLEKHSNSSK